MGTAPIPDNGRGPVLLMRCGRHCSPCSPPAALIPPPPPSQVEDAEDQNVAPAEQGGTYAFGAAAQAAPGAFNFGGGFAQQ
jgi:hypothetical protein